VNTACGITPGPNGPEHVLRVFYVDVLVHDDEHSLGDGKAGERADQPLNLVFALLADLDHGRAHIGQIAHTDDTAHSFALEPAPEARDRPHRQRRRIVSPDRLEGRRAQEDRALAVVERLHLDDRLRHHAPHIVARVFSKRTLVATFHLRGRNLALDRNLRRRRDRQSGQLALDDLYGLPAHEPGIFVFGNAGRGAEATRGGKKENRFLAKGRGYRSGLSLLPMFLEDLEAVVARSLIDAGGRAVMNLETVSADVHSPALGISEDNAITRSDVPPAIQLVPARDGKTKEIDLIPNPLVLQDRSSRDSHRRYAFIMGIALLPASHRFHQRLIGIPFQRYKGASLRAAEVAQDPIVGRVIGYVFKQQRRSLLLERKLGDDAHLQVPVGARDPCDLS
jgi:hypothetical protein